MVTGGIAITRIATGGIKSVYQQINGKNVLDDTNIRSFLNTFENSGEAAIKDLTDDERNSLQELVQRIKTEAGVKGISDLELQADRILENIHVAKDWDALLQSLKAKGLSRADELNQSVWSRLKDWDATALTKLNDDLSALKEVLNGRAELVESWKVLDDLGSSLKTDPSALTKLLDDLIVNPNLATYLKNNPSKKQVWEMLHKTPYSHDIDVLNYADQIKSSASVGTATSNNYTNTFFNAFPNQKFQGNGFVAHHAIEQQVLTTKYPGLFTEAEINSLQNLRGVSPEVNSKLHLSNIRKAWNDFYNQFPEGVYPTRQQVLDKVTEIDNLYGSLFTPPIRPLN